MANDDPNYPLVAPGWKALDQACGRIYPGQVPHQFTSEQAYELDSANPLPAICVWEAEGPPAWHYVTYGLSELFEKSSPRPEISGFGFELSFRLPRTPQHQRPPNWPLRVLQGIGNYVMNGHGQLDTGHVMDLGGPIMGAEESALATALEGVICVPDSVLGQGGKLDTPHGSVLFLLLVGLTREEITSLDGWDLARKVGLIHDITQGGMTEPNRAPWREDPRRVTTLRRYEMKILI